MYALGTYTIQKRIIAIIASNKLVHLNLKRSGGRLTSNLERWIEIFIRWSEYQIGLSFDVFKGNIIVSKAWIKKIKVTQKKRNSSWFCY